MKCNTHGSTEKQQIINKDQKPNESKNEFLHKEIKSENENKKFISSKRQRIVIKRKIKNPRITSFNLNSHFIYDLSKSKSFINNINNKNTMKLKPKEKNFLIDEIKNIEEIYEINEKDKYIDIGLKDLQSINEFFSINSKKDELIEWVETKINENQSRDKISSRKLSKLYYEEKGKKISKTAIHYILKNKLKLKYLTTKIKNSKINLANSVLMCHCFIKIISRAIGLGFKILFLDESAILSKNNNFKCWRKSDENIFSNVAKIKRSNLLLIVSKDDVIFYKINRVSTNENSFLDFLKESLLEIQKKNFEKYIIVLDNLSCHKTPKIYNFFIENKVNVVFNCPYISQFNCVELCFRRIKRLLYMNLYESLDLAEIEVKNLLNSKEIKNTLIKNYKETLQIYLSFSLKNEFKNLNNLEYII